jgi:hypothetical protein
LVDRAAAGPEETPFMIPKASQRGGGQQLATHLLNEFDNDRVEIAEVRGTIAKDLHGAFAEWGAVATGTNCRKYLYSLSVNPDPEQGPLTRDQYRDFVDRTEKKLGLTGQPRALIFHVKHGREHCHAVWSRIDVQTMKAVQLSHDRHSLRSAVIEFARKHGLALPGGMTRDRIKERGQRQRPENLAEQQQEERTGITKAERVAAITAAWKAAPDAKAFAAALKAQGYVLAAGDKRTHVLVDKFGEIHSLSRQLQGVRAKQIRDRLGSAYAADKLPDAAKLQQRIRKRLAERHKTAVSTAQERRDQLAQRQQERRRGLDEQRQRLTDQHRAERKALVRTQKAELSGRRQRQNAPSRGVLEFLKRITGFNFVAGLHSKRQDRLRAEEHKQQRRALVRRHRRELQDFAHRYRGLESVTRRERRSLETLLRREQWRAGMAAPGSVEIPAADRHITPEWQRAATPPTPAVTAGHTLTAPFNKAAKETGPRAQPAQDDKLRGIRDAAREITGPGRTSEVQKEPSLKETFRDAADREAREALEALRRRDARRPERQPAPGRGRDRER